METVQHENDFTTVLKRWASNSFSLLLSLFFRTPVNKLESAITTLCQDDTYILFFIPRFVSSDMYCMVASTLFDISP